MPVELTRARILLKADSSDAGDGWSDSRIAVALDTQPIEEPEPHTQLAEAIDWIGWGRVLFATDYPHWDFDDPAQALPIKLTEAQKRAVFLENAKAVYRQG